MILQRNEIPTSDTFSIDYLKVQNISDDTHLNISTSLTNANILYNNSSVLEDVILEDFLSTYTQAKDIDFAGKNKNRVIESFLTTGLADGTYNIKDRLNIDTQNGSIVLPIISTTDNPVSSIIVESDSNGKPGNSFSGGINSDISVILDSKSQAMFEYEKIDSGLDSKSLTLTLMLELESQTITNGMYIKLFAIENGQYPTIDMVEISDDAQSWEDVKSFGVTSNLNKADYFLRFLPKSIKYARIRFIQTASDSIKTIFGFRYRSVIGIREISLKQIEYGNTGDYISIPFSTGRAINSVKFDYSDISNGDIKYLISGNNGGKYILVPNSGSTISVTNQNAGILDGNEIRTLRVKMSMDKTNSVLNKINATEYLSISPNNKYYLKQVARDVKLACGRHISFGREVRYACETQSIPTPNFLLKYIPYKAAIAAEGNDQYLRVYIDGILQSSDNYTIKESSNPNNSEIEFVQALIDNQTLMGNSLVTIDFREVEYIPNTLTNKNSNIIKLPIPMFYDIESDIIVKEQFGLGDPAVLAPDQYKIIDRQNIKILNSTFKSGATYYVSFIPAFEINNSYKIDNNEIEISAMNTYHNTTIRFDYTYESIVDISLIKYYTPIGLEYSLEIK